MEKPKQILVVDGDQYERIICRVIFQGEEFEVFTEDNREAAIEKISKAEFDLIIVDMAIASSWLPDAHGGLTFVQEARILQHGAAVVVTSDRPSVWDAREALRLGAYKYVVKPLVPEFMRHVARKAFDERGWIVRKAHIEAFRRYRTERKAYIEDFRKCRIPSLGADASTIYYKDGAWARHLEESLWEVGYDVKYLPRADESAHIQLSSGLSSLSAGEAYAKVIGRAGASELMAPMTGTVKEINRDADDIMLSQASGHLGKDWQLWLARIQTPVLSVASAQKEQCNV